MGCGGDFRIMFSYLQEYEYLFGPFRLFQFISVRAIFAGVTALIIGFFAGPRLISLTQGPD